MMQTHYFGGNRTAAEAETQADLLLARGGRKPLLQKGFGFVAESEELDAHTEKRKGAADARVNANLVAAELEGKAGAKRKGTGGEDKSAAFAESVGFGEQQAGATVAHHRDAALGESQASGSALIDG